MVDNSCKWLAMVAAVVVVGDDWLYLIMVDNGQWCLLLVDAVVPSVGFLDHLPTEILQRCASDPTRWFSPEWYANISWLSLGNSLPVVCWWFVSSLQYPPITIQEWTNYQDWWRLKNAHMGTHKDLSWDRNLVNFTVAILSFRWRHSCFQQCHLPLKQAGDERMITAAPYRWLLSCKRQTLGCLMTNTRA